VLSAGIDLGRAGSINSGLSSTEAKLVLKGELDGYWEYGALQVGHPQVEYDYTLNGKNQGTWSLAFTGAVGLGDEPEVGVLGFTIGKKTEAVPAEMTTLRMYWERTVSRMQMNLSGVLAQNQRGRATDEQVQAARDALAAALRGQAQAAELAADLERMQQRPASGATTTSSTTSTTPAPSSPATPATTTKSEFAWAVRFSLGNMSLMRLMALMTGRDP